MHPSILAKRKAIAVNRIVARGAALAQQLELDPALAEALEPRATKDPATVDMLRMEALANFIDQVAVNAGVPPEEQPDTTVGEFIAEPVAQGATPAAVLAEPPAEAVEEPARRKRSKK